MGLVTGITRRLDVPGEDGAYITIRMLSWITLDKARRAKLGDLAGQVKMFSGAQLPPMNPDEAEKAKKEAEADPLTGYDRLTVLKHGITEWSYAGEVDPEHLDERTAEWAAREIIALSVPPEEAIKKGSSRSIVTSEATAN